jgi:mono/diheme cytochrome c family protein
MKMRRMLPGAVVVGFVLLTISSYPATPADARPAAGSSAPTPTAPPSSHPSSSAGPAKGDAEAGKVLYDKFCKKCHGAEGEGVARMYDLVGAKIVHLGSKQAQSKSDAEIKKAMLEGSGKMEVVEDLTPQQADKILPFVRTLSEQKR